MIIQSVTCDSCGKKIVDDKWYDVYFDAHGTRESTEIQVCYDCYDNGLVVARYVGRNVAAVAEKIRNNTNDR